jgi:hypothetical protein
MIHVRESFAKSRPVVALGGALLTIAGWAAACGDDPAEGESPAPPGAEGAGATGGAGGAGGAGGGLPPNGSSWATTACGVCVSGHCRGELTACSDDLDCRAYLDCVSRCPPREGALDAACEARCPGASSPGSPLLEGVRRCWRDAAELCATCPPEPGGGGGGGSGGGPTIPPELQAILQQTCEPSEAADACDACVESNCCETIASCDGDPACAQYAGCLGACLTEGRAPYDCVASCAEQAPGGLAGYAPHYACAENRCFAPGACSDTPPNACEQCLHESCGMATAKCSADEGCFTLRVCMFSCAGDDGCVDQCQLEHSDDSSVPLLQDQLDCQVDHCFRGGPCG